ncbi:MAG: DUF554 family protein [Akkermansiaceae bacterium]|nr:DUF554 family protein [Verrucomicrobiales bacterium]
MTGTWLNVAGIVLGGLFGLLWKKPFSTANQLFIKVVLGAFTVLCGLRLTWAGLNGSFLHILKQVLVVVVALGLGRAAGRLLHLQKISNQIGQFARRKMTAATPNHPNRFSDGFAVCTLLFCAAPLGIVGAMGDGLSNYFYPLGIKAVMDGLGAMGFVAMFGFGVLLSAVPVLVFQGTIALLSARFLLPWLELHGLLDSVNATSGLLIFCVSLIIFEIKKIEVTGYLPSLVFAPLLTYLFR